jgi:hypothetical protein
VLRLSCALARSFTSSARRDLGDGNYEISYGRGIRRSRLPGRQPNNLELRVGGSLIRSELDAAGQEVAFA